MKPKFLTIVFLVSVSIMVAVGFLSLNVTNRLLDSLDRQEGRFKEVATAATEVSSYAKRAEGHLMLYLTLHRIEDKAKFPKRVGSLRTQITRLDQKLERPKARALLSQIVAHNTDLLTIGNALIEDHDRSMEETGGFELNEHRSAIFLLHEKFSGIRRLGVELAAVLFEAEGALKASLHENATRLRWFLLLFFAAAAALTLYSGYALSRAITTLDMERTRLEEALSNVKTLGGLIPICATCKKIRDDKGYWNQLEAYISQHSDANFTHGICPECAKDVYRDLEIDMDGDGDGDT